MLSSLKYDDAKREDGFTLIELLVVVIIIGILAAIAIPVFLNQRTSARESAVESTLRSGANYMEIVYTESTDYPTADDDGKDAIEDAGFREGGVTLTIANSGPAGYCLSAVHDADGTVNGVFDSGDGSPEIDGTCGA